MACGCPGDSNQRVSLGGFFLFRSEWSVDRLFHMHFHGSICCIYNLSCFPGCQLFSLAPLSTIKELIKHRELTGSISSKDHVNRRVFESAPYLLATGIIEA